MKDVFLRRIQISFSGPVNVSRNERCEICPKYQSISPWSCMGGIKVNLNDFMCCAARLKRRGNLKILSHLCLQQRNTHFYHWTGFCGSHSGGRFVGKEGLSILVPRIEPRPCGHLSAHISHRGHPTVSVYNIYTRVGTLIVATIYLKLI